MEKYLIDHHKRHFHQAYGTSFTIHLLRTLIVEHRPVGFARQLREKGINIEALKVSDFTKDILNCLNHHSQIPQY
eukprot:9865796-Ditylum_brightwellii.AAC.1